MRRFSEEGRHLQSSRCPVGGKHEADETWAQLDTFYCRKCGVIPKQTCGVCGGKGTITVDVPD